MQDDKNPAAQSKIVPDPSLDQATYSLSDLALVTDHPIGTVKMWIERHILQMHLFDRAAKGKGSQRLFTLRTAMVAATIAEAVRIGVNPSKAAMWAHVIWRMPFLNEGPVPRGKAVFVGNPNSDDWRICNRDGLSAEVIFQGTDSERGVPAAPAASAILIDVAAIDLRCRAALGVHDMLTEPQ